MKNSNKNLLNIGDLLYDGEHVGMIIEIYGSEYITEWYGQAIEYPVETTSNRPLLLAWRSKAQTIKSFE